MRTFAAGWCCCQEAWFLRGERNFLFLCINHQYPSRKDIEHICSITML